MTNEESQTKWLENLGDTNLVLRQPIPIRIEWSTTMHAHVAFEDAFSLWYALGSTEQEAKGNLAAVIVDAYRDFEAEREHLSVHLQKCFASMQQVIAKAE